MRYSPFHRQLSENDRKLFNHYKDQFLSVNSEKDANKVLELLSHKNQGIPDWLESLHADVIDRNKKRESPEYSDVLFDYFLDIELLYWDSIDIKPEDPASRLGRLITDGFDLNEPHFEWIKLVDKQVNETIVSHPEITARQAARHAWEGFGLNIDINKFAELVKLRDDEDYIGMSVHQFAKWHEKTAINFNDGKPGFVMAQKMNQVLSGWTESEPFNSKIVEKMCSHLNIHPSFRSGVKEWANAWSSTLKSSQSIQDEIRGLSG